MATFCVVSSRRSFGQQIDTALASIRNEAGRAAAADFTEALASLIEEHYGALVVYREDLDDDHDLREVLMAEFGAAIDDEILEIDLGVVSSRKAA